MKPRNFLHPVIIILSLIFTGCAENSPRIVYVTATPPQETSFQGTPQIATLVTVTPVNSDREAIAVDNVNSALAGSPPKTYVIQGGDTLSNIALRFGTTVDTLIEINNITNADVISVGQVLQLPDDPSELSPSTILLPDRRLVRSIDSKSFDVAGFIGSSTGYIRTVTDEIDRRGATGFTTKERLPAAEVIEEVALQYSVDPRVLLALLEYRANWLTQVNIPEELRDYPLVPKDAAAFDRKGLYRQLSWAANELNRGYYQWKYEGRWVLEFENGNRISINPEVNPATAAIHYLLHLQNTAVEWLRDVTEIGFIQTYRDLFGDPFIGRNDPLLPVPLYQPEFSLPFNQGEVWYFTGGMHGGWGSGSAWAAIDFAPPDERTGVLCFVSDYRVTAVADGVITHSENGMVILDIDGDGDETTGWIILYLHLAVNDRVNEGVFVKQGDSLGRASCEGGFSTATHVHIARRFNGEWVPATCFGCSENVTVSNFNLGGWEVIGLPGQEYQGFLQKQGDQRVAEQGRETPINQIEW